MSTLDKIAESSNKPLVSVVMPHWNTWRYVKEAIDSIASQTFLDNGDLELIVIDDGSPRVQYGILRMMIAYQKWHHKGRFANFEIHRVSHRGKNRVLEEAKEYINARRSRYTFVADSDDVFAPTFVQSLFDHLEAQRVSDTNVVMAYCDSILIDESGFCFGTATAPDFDRRLYFGQDGNGGSNFIPGNALVKTERFLAGIPKDLNAPFNLDKHSRHMAELGESGGAVRIPNRDFFYRQRDDQMSGYRKQLEKDPRYGKDGFFALWPKDIPKPHWIEWVGLPRVKQLELLEIMPNAGNIVWDYRAR